MKLSIICSKCASVEQDKPSYKSVLVEFRDDGKYEFKCQNGHKTMTVLQLEKFELLFDIGAYAIRDGYYREALNTFTTSLELFYEFYIKVISIERNITKEVFELSWKKIATQSERQLGAFIFLYQTS